MKTRTLIAFVAAAVPMLAAGQTISTPRIDQRQAYQDTRIDRGVQSGALTQQEAARLDRGQAHVQKLENRVMADGTVTKKEAARVEHAQDVQSRHIYRQKHDRQHDFNHDGRIDRPQQVARNGSQARGHSR